MINSKNFKFVYFVSNHKGHFLKNFSLENMHTDGLGFDVCFVDNKNKKEVYPMVYLNNKEICDKKDNLITLEILLKKLSEINDMEQTKIYLKLNGNRFKALTGIENYFSTIQNFSKLNIVTSSSFSKVLKKLEYNEDENRVDSTSKQFLIGRENNIEFHLCNGFQRDGYTNYESVCIDKSFVTKKLINRIIKNKQNSNIGVYNIESESDIDKVVATLGFEYLEKLLSEKNFTIFTGNSKLLEKRLVLR